MRPNRRLLRGAYGLSNQRLAQRGSRLRASLNAVQIIRRGSFLTFTFRAIARG